MSVKQEDEASAVKIEEENVNNLEEHK